MYFTIIEKKDTSKHIFYTASVMYIFYDFNFYIAPLINSYEIHVMCVSLCPV